MIATQGSLFGDRVISTINKMMRRYCVSHQVFENGKGGVIVINVKGWGNLDCCYGEGMKPKYRKALPEDEDPPKKVIKFAEEQARAVLTSHLERVE